MKSKRQAKIMEIISTTNVETQEQLLKELQEAGFTSTQATISRHLPLHDGGKRGAQRLYGAAEHHFPGMRHQL